MNNRTTIGLQIADARKKKGLTQQQLAELAGVNRVNIAKIENGRYNVSIDILSRVCNAMECEIIIKATN